MVEKKYSTEFERKQAARDAAYLKDLPRKLEVNRRRHEHVVKEIKRAGLDELLSSEEKGWA